MAVEGQQQNRRLGFSVKLWRKKVGALLTGVVDRSILDALNKMLEVEGARL